MWPESDLSLVGPVAVSCSCGSLDTTTVSLQATRNCTGSYEGGAMWVGTGDTVACRFSREAQDLCAISTVRCYVLTSKCAFITLVTT